MSTPVRAKRETVVELRRLKVYLRETYDDVIKRLIEVWKERTHS